MARLRCWSVMHNHFTLLAQVGWLLRESGEGAEVCVVLEEQGGRIAISSLLAGLLAYSGQQAHRL